MRFAVVAAALVGVVAAGKDYAQSTTYVTEEITITSCAPTVTNCPARSTVTSTTSYPVITSSKAPVVYTNSTSSPAVVVPPASSVAVVAVQPQVVTVTVSACPATVPAASSTPAAVVVPAVSPAAVASNVPIPPKNSTSPPPSQFTGAASSLGGSIALAGLAGLAAVVLA